jgi:cell wall-associated NlpC family hydrolase
MAQATGISGKALGLATAGGILVYAGLRGENPLEAIRSVLTGSPAPVPEGKTVTLSMPLGSSDGAVTGAASASMGKAVSVALQQVGKPYRWAATGPDRFDCSGLIVYSMRKAGLNVPRWTSYSLSVSPRWQKISRSEVRAGDVCWKLGHVALATSNNAIVEAPRSGVPVRTRALSGFSMYLQFKG